MSQYLPLKGKKINPIKNYDDLTFGVNRLGKILMEIREEINLEKKEKIIVDTKELKNLKNSDYGIILL